jgi:hypothetical protein
MFATRALTASGGVSGPAKENGIWALLRTHEDIWEASDVGGIANLPKPDRRMLEIGEEIIEHQEGKFDPLTFKDRYEDAVRDVIARKKRGQKMTTASPVEKEAGKVIDLMDALRRSLAPARAAARRSAPSASSSARRARPLPKPIPNRRTAPRRARFSSLRLGLAAGAVRKRDRVRYQATSGIMWTLTTSPASPTRGPVMYPSESPTLKAADATLITPYVFISSFPVSDPRRRAISVAASQRLGMRVLNSHRLFLTFCSAGLSS